MAVPESGAISLNDLHVEAGGSSGTTVSFNDADIRDMRQKGSGGQASLNEYYGAAIDWNQNTTVGQTLDTITISQYSSTSHLQRGFASSTGRNIEWGSTTGTYGALSATQNDSYFQNTTINRVRVRAQSAYATNSTFIISVDAVIANNDINAFKSIKMYGHTAYSRSAATYSSGTSPSNYSTWSWATGQSPPGNANVGTPREYLNAGWIPYYSITGNSGTNVGSQSMLIRKKV